MKKVFFYILPIAFVSCVSHKQGLKKFQPIEGADKYEFIVPQGYAEEKRFAGGREYFSQEYYYPDSSVFYVTTFSNTPNYEEIRKQGTFYERFDALNEGDTITLSGVNEQGLYWKDRLLTRAVTIGYSKVPFNKISDFEKGISSIRRVK